MRGRFKRLWETGQESRTQTLANNIIQRYMNNLLTIPCAIESVATRKDKTIRVVIGTQELNPIQITELMSQWIGGIGVMAFKGEQFNYNDEELLNSIKLDAAELGGKTPSQRLRSTLYVLYEQNNEGHKDFNMFYIGMMERFIDMVKKRIDTYNL
jgi:hypothetical protein